MPASKKPAKKHKSKQQTTARDLDLLLDDPAARLQALRRAVRQELHIAELRGSHQDRQALIDKFEKFSRQAARMSIELSRLRSIRAANWGWKWIHYESCFAEVQSKCRALLQASVDTTLRIRADQKTDRSLDLHSAIVDLCVFYLWRSRREQRKMAKQLFLEHGLDQPEESTLTKWIQSARRKYEKAFTTFE